MLSVIVVVMLVIFSTADGKVKDCKTKGYAGDCTFGNPRSCCPGYNCACIPPAVGIDENGKQVEIGATTCYCS